MRGIVVLVIILAGCAARGDATPSAVAPSAVAPSVVEDGGSEDRVTGEVVFDGGWPSEYREGCLSILDGKEFVELVTSDDWFMTRDSVSGWFDIRDVDDEILMREHRLVTVTGRFLERPGCREGTLFEVTGFEPPPQTAAALHVEVVGGLGFSEGSVNVVRISDDAGKPLMQQPLAAGENMEIPSGSLTLLDYQKGCDGNCGTAYGAEAQCETHLDVSPGDVITVSVLLSPEPPACQLLSRSGDPADLVALIEVSPFDGALLPYRGVERCVLVGSAVPVLPEGWTIEMREPESDRYEVTFVDPDGRVAARDGDIVWLNGTMTEEQRPFGCDMGTRFDVVEIVQVRTALP